MIVKARIARSEAVVGSAVAGHCDQPDVPQTRQLAHPCNERLDVPVGRRPEDGAPATADVEAVGLVGSPHLCIEQLEEALGYHAAPIMAVPKRKTSKSRRDKRRATHAISAPKVNVCPTCGQPKRPHRVCPTCGQYKGREVEPLRVRAP